MTKKTRIKIAYIFFLAVGMIGVLKQLHLFINDELPITFTQGALCVFFGMLIFKPMVLLDLLDDARVKFFGAKNRMFKSSLETGGETPVEDDEDSPA